MQVLAAQYTKLYTRKFRVSYSDFVAHSPSEYRVKLFTMPKTWEVLFTKIWNRQSFDSSLMTSCTVFIVAGISLGVSSYVGRYYAAYLGKSPSFDYSGTEQATPIRRNTAVNPEGNLISYQSADNEVWAVIVRNTTTGPPPLTAGSFDIWVTTARFP